MLIRDALAGRDRDAVRISVTFGALRDPAARGPAPAAARRCGTPSPTRCAGGTDRVDVLPARPPRPGGAGRGDVGTIADLVREGYVRHAGRSEAGADTTPRAAAVHPISDLQIEYPLVSRSTEEAILSTCRGSGSR